MPPPSTVTNILFICFIGLSSIEVNGAPYLGKFLGKLTELHHGVSGEVYAVDARTLHIKDFTYDGQGPAAYFFAGSSRAPGNTGFRIRDENGSPDVLRRYRKEGVTITLPEGKSLNNIKWFSVWCEEYEVNFGDVKIPKNFDYPRPQKIDGLRGVHNVNSDNIVIVDAQTLLVPSLSYDGEAPDAKFWVGRGPKPSPQGVRVPDENGKEIPLRRYDRKTVVLTLPGDLTVFDIGHFGIWCEAFTVDFGHVQIPQDLNVPPSLKMLGVSPQSKLNCEVLHDDLAFEVRWAVAGDSIVLQLVAKLENREYMSFGISGDEGRSQMVGGDVVVAWVDKETLKGYAEDYYLEAKSQCSGPRGSCPDAKLADNSNNIRLLNAAMVNGYSIVTYQRPLRPADTYDKAIFTNHSQPVIWAIGPLNQRDEVSFHSQYNKKDKIIDFGRAAKWNCPMPEGDQPSMKPVTARPVQAAYVADEEERIPATPPPTPAPTRTRGRTPERRGGSNRGSPAQQIDNERSQSSQTTTRQRGTPNRGASRASTRPPATPAPVSNRNAWVIPPIQCDEPDDGVFYAQMGPTGGKHGYPAITGHVGWGICWYINGLLIPEINVVRGKTYTFVVEGGHNPETPANYHPFYITDDPIGGYEYKTIEERQNVTIFAGAGQAKDGTVQPTGIGRLCHWTHQGESEADDFDSFGAYQRTLELRCDKGEPGVIQWTPDKDTPDTVYYQCFTHRYLGWKINVLDSCEISKAASEIHETVVAPDSEVDAEGPKDDLADSPSIRVETRVKPNNLEDVLNKNEQIIYEKDTVEIVKPVVEEEVISETTPRIDKTIQELPDVEKKFTFRSDSRKNLTLIPGSLGPHGPPRIPFGLGPQIMPMGKVVLRRPSVHHQTVMASMPRPTYVKHRRPTMFVKKPIYRPYMKAPISRPWMGPPMKYEKPLIFSMPPPGAMISRQPVHPPIPMHPPHNVIIMKPQNKPIVTSRMPEPQKLNAEPNVEVSKPQPSTERSETISFNEKPINVQAQQSAPSEKHYKTILIPMKQAINTGFDPSSVVIESGFKPIISKDIESRVGQVDGPEIEIESEAGVIDETQASVNSETNKEPTAQATEYFEPMFIPSPTIDMKKALKKKIYAYNKMMNAARRSTHYGREYEFDLEEPAGAANERVDAYYLPPDTRRSKPIERPRHRSNIDMAPGTVITFDGRKVSGASLTARGGPVVSLTSRSSKGAELLRHPQSAPFKGDLPPLNLKVDLNAPQLQSRSLNRELDLPAGSIKQTITLRELHPSQEDELVPLGVSGEERSKARKKRAAHHTEEHTAQQEQERKDKEKKEKSAASSVQITMSAILVCLVFQHFV